MPHRPDGQPGSRSDDAVSVQAGDRARSAGVGGDAHSGRIGFLAAGVVRTNADRVSRDVSQSGEVGEEGVEDHRVERHCGDRCRVIRDCTDPDINVESGRSSGSSGRRIVPFDPDSARCSGEGSQPDRRRWPIRNVIAERVQDDRDGAVEVLLLAVIVSSPDAETPRSGGREGSRRPDRRLGLDQGRSTVSDSLVRGL